MIATRIDPQAPLAERGQVRRRPSRAKPRPPRPVQLILAELRGLGGLVLEQGLLSPTGRPPASLIAWQRRLAVELATEEPTRARSYRELLHQIVALSRKGIERRNANAVASP